MNLQLASFWPSLINPLTSFKQCWGYRYKHMVLNFKRWGKWLRCLFNISKNQNISSVVLHFVLGDGVSQMMKHDMLANPRWLTSSQDVPVFILQFWCYRHMRPCQDFTSMLEFWTQVLLFNQQVLLHNEPSPQPSHLFSLVCKIYKKMEITLGAFPIAAKKWCGKGNLRKLDGIHHSGEVREAGTWGSAHVSILSKQVVMNAAAKFTCCFLFSSRPRPWHNTAHR